MGIDCEILFQTKDGGREHYVKWEEGWRVEPADEVDREDYSGCTHYVYTLCRYFGPYYARGPWLEIKYHLIQLLWDVNVVKVWYGGDSGLGLREVTPELMQELDDLYMSGGKL